MTAPSAARNERPDLSPVGGAAIDARSCLLAAHALEQQGQTGQAEQVYRAALQAFPAHPDLQVNLARLLRNAAPTLDEALGLLYQTVAAWPDHAPARLSLIETLRTAAGRPQEAAVQARSYVQRYPADGNGHRALALALYMQGQLAQALAAAEQAAVLPGKQAQAWELAANIHIALGDAPGAVQAYREQLACQSDADIHSRLLVSMQYCDSIAPADIFQESLRWARLHGAGVACQTHWPLPDPDPQRVLRVGFVSGDFRQCSTPLLALPLFENWPADWEVSLYSSGVQDDAWTARFRRTAAHWVDIAALDDAQAAARIADDGIDVLFDLNGHTHGGRLGVFLRKPAPVQLAWLNLAGSTGLATFDAIIGDAWHLPFADQPLYTEPIRQVAHNRYRYLPCEDAPAVAGVPLQRNGFVTFGSFNSAYKISASTVAHWAAILQALPSARLVLNSREFGHADTRARFAAAFAGHGVAAVRLLFRPGAPDALGMLGAYQEIDIALDAFPYSGGLTTLEALYMGVPVITMPGHSLASRHSYAHLATLGLTDWVAADGAAYVALALQKAAAVQELATLRSSLRARLCDSVLLDGPSLAQSFSELVRDLWLRAITRAPDAAPAPRSSPP